MHPPDAIGRCRSCPLQAALWDGLCLHCRVRCAICRGRRRVRVVYGRTPSGHMERTCQSCWGSGRKPGAA